jgi:hypothetical protein
MKEEPKALLKKRKKIKIIRLIMLVFSRGKGKLFI